MAVRMTCPSCHCATVLQHGQPSNPPVCADCGVPLIAQGGSAPMPRKSAMPWVIIGCVVTPIVAVIIGGVVLVLMLIFLRASDQAKEDQARAGVKMLESAVQACYTDPMIAQYPPSLVFLAAPFDGRKPFIDHTALLDPWKQPYQYNPAETHFTTGIPRIWSLGPPGRNQPISNW